MRLFRKKFFFRKMGFLFPVGKNEVSESYAYFLGIFWHGENDKSLKTVSFAYSRNFSGGADSGRFILCKHRDLVGCKLCIFIDHCIQLLLYQERDCVVHAMELHGMACWIGSVLTRRTFCYRYFLKCVPKTFAQRSFCVIFR